MKIYMKFYRKPAKQVQIAKKRVIFLFKEAGDVFRQNPSLADKYIKTARRIAMKYKIKLPSSLKRKFCRHCNSFLMPGINSRVRIHKHRLIYYCQKCRNYTRLPLH